MGLASTRSVSLAGVTGRVVEIEVDISPGLPGLTFTGLADASVSESRERVRAAIVNSGLSWPAARLTAALLPADLRKSGSTFDLALALAILAANGAIPPLEPDRTAWVGELGLDGRLRPVRGALPAVIAARQAGIVRCVVPAPNGPQAACVEGIEVFGAASLREIVLALTGEGPALTFAEAGPVSEGGDEPDLSEVIGQLPARRAIEVAAAGGHHVLLTGSPGAGKTMLATRLAGVLPRLEEAAALEVSAIHSVAGLLGPGSGLMYRPPTQQPHHTASMPALVGGGSGLARPGAVTLAHRGVLILDEAAEFSPRVLDALRQPMESGRVVLHRSGGAVDFPARFQLVLATNPCPCGASRDTDCRCTPDARRRYGQRLSGPLLDRVDLRVAMDPVTRAELMDDTTERESSAAVRPRVLRARMVSASRWRAHGWRTNAEVPGELLRRRPWRPAPTALRPLDRALERGELSARGWDRVLRLAWTVADLAGHASPGASEIGEALFLRSGRTELAA